MNNVCLIGRFTHDIELRTTSTGVSCIKNSLAVPGRANANGEPHTDFINIVIWRNQADNVSKYCKKGDMVGIVGRIQTGSYQDQDGNTKYTTDVVADSVKFLNTKGNSSEQNVSAEPDPFDGMTSEVVLSDDDLPF